MGTVKVKMGGSVFPQVKPFLWITPPPVDKVVDKLRELGVLDTRQTYVYPLTFI